MKVRRRDGDVGTSAALIISVAIRPGGGPAGYVYNLREYYESATRDPKVTIEFVGSRSTERMVSSIGAETRLTATLDLVRASVVGAAIRAVKSRASNDFRRLRSKALASDVVVFQGFQPRSAFMRELKRAGVRTVYMPHSPTVMADEVGEIRRLTGRPLGARAHSWYLREESRMITNADVVVFPSERSASSYDGAFEDPLCRARIVHINSGVARPGVLRNPFAGTQQFRIAFVGRYLTDKGFDTYLEAAERVSRSMDDVAFVSVGAGPMKVNSHVQDLGWRADPHSVLAEIDLVVVPNRVAYFDLLPLEAAAMGIGIVFTPVGGNIDQHNLLPDSVIAARPSPDSVADAIREAVQRLRNDRQWGAGNISSYNQHFTMEKCGRAWDEFLLSLAKGV